MSSGFVSTLGRSKTAADELGEINRKQKLKLVEISRKTLHALSISNRYKLSRDQLSSLKYYSSLTFSCACLSQISDFVCTNVDFLLDSNKAVRQKVVCYLDYPRVTHLDTQQTKCFNYARFWPNREMNIHLSACCYCVGRCINWSFVNGYNAKW